MVITGAGRPGGRPAKSLAGGPRVTLPPRFRCRVLDAALAMSHWGTTMRTLHILVVNGRNVRQPVFVLGAPHSGADLVARALKRSAGFHVTMGQPSVRRVVHAFARRPAIVRGRGEAASAVLRDAFAQAWQVSAHGCLYCSPSCRLAGGVG